VSAKQDHRRRRATETWEIPPDWRPGNLVNRRRFVQAHVGAGLTSAQKQMLRRKKSESGAAMAEIIRRCLNECGVFSRNDGRSGPPDEDGLAALTR